MTQQDGNLNILGQRNYQKYSGEVHHLDYQFVINWLMLLGVTLGQMLK